MEQKEPARPAAFELTLDVSSNQDLGRIIREVHKLDEFLYQTKIRTPGKSPVMPKTTMMLERLAEANGLSLLNESDRKQLTDSLQRIEAKGNKVHVSFAVEPSPAVTQKIVGWMRQNIERNLIINIGIQPTISVGCVVRTTNKIFDMSLKHRFSGSNNILSDLLEKSQ